VTFAGQLAEKYAEEARQLTRTDPLAAGQFAIAAANAAIAGAIASAAAALGVGNEHGPGAIEELAKAVGDIAEALRG
jgi:hypothetical protein